ncbi:MAG TPA: hypothetical protein VFN61_13330 [Acidimicrobiales bacterium]|nr:hypothetical protein [Acidimicrobiales bacterium]
MLAPPVLVPPVLAVTAKSLVAGIAVASAGAGGDTVAIAVAVVSTVVVLALCAALVYLLKAVRQLRREASALAKDAGQLVEEMAGALERAESELDRVDRMVGSAEAISDAVGSASRLVGGVVADPLIKLVALGSGIAEGARHLTGAPSGVATKRRSGPTRAITPRAREGRAGLPNEDGKRRRGLWSRRGRS